MGKLICAFILKLMGWKMPKHLPNHVKKSVVVMAPHTSNWDFVIGRHKIGFIIVPPIGREENPHFIYQGATGALHVNASMPNNASALIQVMDLNRGGLVFANDRALVASGTLHLDGNGGYSSDADLFPDNFGKGSDDGRYVVNDQLYLEATIDGTTVAATNIVVRVNASIVSLGAKDFMAIAIQSTAADN